MKYTFYFKKTIFFLFLLSEIGICSSASAMFRDFFTDDEIMQAVVQRHIVRGEPAAEPDSLREDIGVFQAALATQDPRVFYPVVEAILSLSMHKTITEYINCLEGSHQGVGSGTDSLRFVMTGQEQEDDIKNKRAGRIFEMLDYYVQHSPSINVEILKTLQSFLQVYMPFTKRYTIQSLHVTLSWCMKLLDPPTSWILSKEYEFDQSKKKCLFPVCQRIASRFFEDFTQCKMEVSFVEDPYFERALTSAIEFRRKHEQDYYAMIDLKRTDNLNDEIFFGINSSSITEHYFSGNREAHSDFMERLLPSLYVRDNYVDYRLFNEGVRVPVVTCKFERSEEEGLAYVLSVVNEQGVRFPITSEGKTEVRPPVDSAFAGVAYAIYKRKYIQELMALLGVPERDRDYKTLHELENSMELYKMLEIQGMVEFSPYLKRFIKLTEDRRQNRSMTKAYKKARARVKKRQGDLVSSSKISVGKNAPVVQAFPKATHDQGYNVAGEYRGNKDGGSTSGIAASSAAASSSTQSTEVKAISKASTSAPREPLSSPLIILGSHHYDTFEAIINGQSVTRSAFAGLLLKLQGPPKNHSASVSSRQAQDRSSGDHFFYSVRPIGESLRLDANAANQLRQTLNLSTGIEESENEINQLLEQLGLNSHRQGILLSGIGPQDNISAYQIRQIKEHLELAGYTMQTVGKKR